MNCKCVDDVSKKEKQVEEESFATAILKSKDRTIKLLTFIIVVMLVLFTGYILYDNYQDSQYETIDYCFEQDGEGYNNINTGSQGDVINGTETESQN